jgi:hypothetical protein
MATVLKDDVEYKPNWLEQTNRGQHFRVGEIRIKRIDDDGNPIEGADDVSDDEVGSRLVPFIAYSVFTTYTEEELAEMQAKGIRHTKIRPDEPIAAVMAIDMNRVEQARNALRSLSYCIRSGRDSTFKKED